VSILSARGLDKSYGNRTLLRGASLTVRAGEKVGLLGVNGAGKSTLLRLLAGLEPPDAGVIDKRRDARVLYLPQEPELDPDATPRAIVTEGLAEWHVAIARYQAVSRALEAGDKATSLVDEQARLAEAIERLGGWSREHVVTEMLEKLGIRDLDRPSSALSGGERRRVALARLLVASPDLAILDEPTNHLDADTIAWLEQYLADTFEGAVLMVTHDRYVLDAVVDRIVELEDGLLTEYAGGYADFLEAKAERLAHAERVEANRLNFLRRERAWLMRGAKARTTKQKARIQRAEAAMAVEAPKAQARVQIEANAARLGRTILELRDVAAATFEPGSDESFDGASSEAPRTLFSGLTLHMAYGDRIGIVGPNGAGKTTLLRIVLGERRPQRGEVVRGAQTKVAYFDQARERLELDWTVFDNVAEREGALQSGGGVVRLGDQTMELRSYLERFLFDGHKQRQKVSSLSGGERARVALAKTMKREANLLILDEPTNDLDVATLGALEEMLDGWPGCALVVSHDRYFLNRVVNAILAFEPQPDGSVRVVRYPGNYDTYRSLREQAEARAKDESREKAAGKGASGASSAPAGSASRSASATPRTNEAGPPAKKPLTYAERLELETIFDRIAEAEAEVEALEAQLADPSLYTSRASEVAPLQEKLEKARADVSRLSQRWEDLEARRGG
jgi:ATP-binding cassette subfamily F protein uup